MEQNLFVQNSWDKIIKHIQTVIIIIICISSAIFTYPIYAAETQQTSLPSMAIVLQNSRLREGPGTNYTIVGSAQTNQLIRITGCNAGCTWYQLENGAWIAAFLAELSSAPAPTASPIPEPTAIPIAVVAVPPALAKSITVIAWNVESGGSQPELISQRIAAFQDVDLWGL